MEEKYVALYRQGDCQPIGAVRAELAEKLLRDLRVAICGGDYWTMPITTEQAKDISEKITRNSISSEEVSLQGVVDSIIGGKCHVKKGI